MHSLHNMFYFERKKHWYSIFTVFVHGNSSTAMLFFFISRFNFFFVRRVCYCHKMLRLRFCRGPKSSSVDTNLNFTCKQSYSGAWRKITTGYCELNLWPLNFKNFKIQYQSKRCDHSVKWHMNWTQSSD